MSPEPPALVVSCVGMIGFVLATAVLAGPVEVEPEELRPGLVAAYRSQEEPGETVHRIDPKPAFTLGHSSPHPRISPGPFGVVWGGLLRVQEPGPISFHARVGGEVEIEVDGLTVLRGRGETDTGRAGPAAVLERGPGCYRLSIRYRSLDGVPARLQVFWEAPSFAREPIPAWRLGHLPADVSPEGKREELVEQGRAAAARLGCARCHSAALPALTEPPPGPSLADAGRRLDRAWLVDWLADPAKVRAGARMPALFANDRRGFVERRVIAEALTPPRVGKAADPPPAQGDHRAGRRAFLGLGCAACHLIPDPDRPARDDPGRLPILGLGDRMRPDDLAAFLGNPHARYPDGRMPRLPLTPATARDVAAYLLLWSTPSPARTTPPPTTADEVRDLARRLGVPGPAAATALLREKGCASCHPGIGQSEPLDVPLKTAAGGCLSDQPGTAPRYTLDGPTREALTAYLGVAGRETHPAPFASRRRQLERAGCVRCHQRDGDRPPPIEEVGATLGGGMLTTLPFQRTPRLTNPHQKFLRGYLLAAVREGVSGLRPADYTYRMPAYGPEAEALVQALAEADGELPAGPEPTPRPVDDPTLGTLNGPALVGPQGYGCISCHAWGGTTFSQSDPGAVGPDLTRTVGRLRRDWFDRYVEDPGRFYPGTPMPAIFPRGKPASLGAVLGGDPGRQKDALWAYFAAGTHAPAPKPPPPLPIAAPAPGAPPLVAQIPIRLPGGAVVESLCVLNDRNDLLIYDLAASAPLGVLTGARILRDVQGRTRRFLASGTGGPTGAPDVAAWQLVVRGQTAAPASKELLGYDRLVDGVRVRWRAHFDPGTDLEVAETLRVERDDSGGRLVRELRLTGVPEKAAVSARTRLTEPAAVGVTAATGAADGVTSGATFTATLTADARGVCAATVRQALPAARVAPAWEGKPTADTGRAEGSLERPGYRAIAYPRPKTVSGEDRVMPAAVAVDPRDGRVFVASLKTGELHVLRDPNGDGRGAHFENYARGLFQDALSMRAEDDALYVLHRRNLTRVRDTDGDGLADRFDRVAALPHGVADTYDYAYGLVRDPTGAFLLSYAPHANATLPGSGGVVRLVPGHAPKEVAYGFRNPLGWCNGPKGDVFFTDNQGDWVAVNKLCHLEEGRFYGYPNPSQPGHVDRPAGKPAVWVPYGWARSINGVTCDTTGGKFGPFAGQFFLAELMFGGAIVRADVEVVNGRYQGACFPFWGKGLMGPVSLAFDPSGRLYVGGITEPGWMAQPDRGALFRIDYTGPVPFEMRTIRVLPRGFRIEFTAPVDRASAADPASYRLEHHRYEYTGAYGSPELDRTASAVARASVSADGLSVALTTSRLVADRVYLLAAPGVRSAVGKPLVQPQGAYTLHEIPPAR